MTRGRLTVNGTTETDVLEITGGADLAEPFAINDTTAVEPGTVVVLDADDELETIGQVAGFVDYRHWWTDKLRSSANLSVYFADNDAALTGPDVNQSAQSISVNLLYSPRPPLTPSNCPVGLKA